MKINSFQFIRVIPKKATKIYNSNIPLPPSAETIFNLKKKGFTYEESLKALVIERAIFFVLLPFFRFNGDAGLATVSADISRDEQIHVASNSLVCAELGFKPSQSLDKLRVATINWIMQPLKMQHEDQYLSKKFWLECSDRLMYEGKAPQLVTTKAARMPAFFEHDNRNLPQYA